MALTIFAFNKTPQQFSIREAGGIKYSVFENFINTPDEFYQCYAAFQVSFRENENQHHLYSNLLRYIIVFLLKTFLVLRCQKII